jgi:hypothetical protein
LYFILEFAKGKMGHCRLNSIVASSCTINNPINILKDRAMDYKLTVEVLEARIAPIGWSLGGQ